MPYRNQQQEKEYSYWRTLVPTLFDSIREDAEKNFKACFNLVRTLQG